MTYTEDISHEPRPWFRSWPSHLPKHLAYPNVPAWWILERNLERFADKDAVLFLHHENRTELDRLTYRELWDRANALAAGLYDLGIRRGDCVGTLIPNSPAIITSYYGIWMAGAAITPCNALASKKEFTHQLQDAGAKILIAAKTMADMAMSAAEGLDLRVILAPVGETVAALPADAVRFDNLIHTGRKRPADVVIDPRDDMAVLLYTGGTTGDPKGAVLTHRNIVANTMQFAEWYALDPGKEVLVCTIPMSHSGGYKVWPREVEEILYTHPEVRMAMVFGVSDDYYGETVKACIVLKGEAKETITKDEITAFCKKKMASYKVPKHIEFRDSLPISAQGKMLRRLMKEG